MLAGAPAAIPSALPFGSLPGNARVLGFGFNVVFPARKCYFLKGIIAPHRLGDQGRTEHETEPWFRHYYVS